MYWLYITAFSYFLSAVAFVFDKYLLVNRIPKPFAYAFWVSILSTFALVLIPFGVTLPNPNYIFVAMSSGAAFFIALFFLYSSIKKSDITASSTNVGGLTALFTYVFAILILKDIPSMHNSAALIILVVGLFILGYGQLDRNSVKWILIAGAYFGLSFVCLKWAINIDLINGIFWTRMGLVGSAFVSLLFPDARKEIFRSFKKSDASSRTLFLVNKITAAGAAVALYIAIKLGNVSLINGLLGMQFLFVFLIALLFRRGIPGIAENFNRKIIIQKVIGLIFVAAGFSYLYLVI